VMEIFLLFYMCHFAMGLTHCYKTTVFLHLFNKQISDWIKTGNTVTVMRNRKPFTLCLYKYAVDFIK